MSDLVRETRETRVSISIAASGTTRISTTDAFLDHMLTALARDSGLAVTIEATGDLRHHLIEDVAITLGLALRDYIPATCRRYGDRILVMERGGIVEQGTHAELVAANGLYARLARLQFEGV